MSKQVGEGRERDREERGKVRERLVKGWGRVRGSKRGWKGKRDGRNR